MTTRPMPTPHCEVETRVGRPNTSLQLTDVRILRIWCRSVDEWNETMGWRATRYDARCATAGVLPIIALSLLSLGGILRLPASDCPPSACPEESAGPRALSWIPWHWVIVSGFQSPSLRGRPESSARRREPVGTLAPSREVEATARRHRIEFC